MKGDPNELYIDYLARLPDKEEGKYHYLHLMITPDEKIQSEGDYGDYQALTLGYFDSDAKAMEYLKAEKMIFISPDDLIVRSIAIVDENGKIRRLK